MGGFNCCITSDINMLEIAGYNRLILSTYGHALAIL